MILLTLTLSGCYMKLVEPDAVSFPGKGTRDFSALKFSYAVLNVEGSVFRGDAEQALRAVFEAKGIKDVVRSEKLERDRINIRVYVLQSRPTTLSRYIDFPSGVISAATLFLVPYYMETGSPVEIHVIDPGREPGKQLKIIREEPKFRIVGWLPYLFKMQSPTAEDEAYYFISGPGASIKLNNTGLRRVLDRVITDAVAD